MHPSPVPSSQNVNWTRLPGMRQSIASVVITLLLCGCNPSHRQLSGGYYLERFDENGAFYTVYYVGARGKPVNGGGVFDGTVQEIGWNNDWILARVRRIYRGDPDGWYLLNVKTGQVTGPLQSSELKTNPALPNIRTIEPAAVFAASKSGRTTSGN
jgi:hypothetical protein